MFSNKQKSVDDYPSVNGKLKYVNRIHTLQKDNWKYYHRICNCTLYSQLLIGDSRTPSGTVIKIALSLGSVFVINLCDEVINSFLNGSRLLL